MPRVLSIADCLCTQSTALSKGIAAFDIFTFFHGSHTHTQHIAGRASDGVGKSTPTVLCDVGVFRQPLFAWRSKRAQDFVQWQRVQHIGTAKPDPAALSQTVGTSAWRCDSNVLSKTLMFTKHHMVPTTGAASECMLQQEWLPRRPLSAAAPQTLL